MLNITMLIPFVYSTISNSTKTEVQRQYSKDDDRRPRFSGAFVYIALFRLHG